MMDRPGLTPDSRVTRPSFWNPAVSSSKSPDQQQNPCPNSRAPPPAAHQSAVCHLNRLHQSVSPSLAAPPPAHRSDPSHARDFRPGNYPPHIYSHTLGAFPANSHMNVTKSNFTSVDSLISKSSPVSVRTEPSRTRPHLTSRSEPQSSVSSAAPSHWTPSSKNYAHSLPFFPIANNIATPFSMHHMQQQQPAHRLSPKSDHSDKRRSRETAVSLPHAMPDVTHHMFPDQRLPATSLISYPNLHPNHMQSHPAAHLLTTTTTTTTHPQLQTSHPPLPAHSQLHHPHLPDERLLPGHRLVAHSTTYDNSRLCDNHNVSPMQPERLIRSDHPDSHSISSASIIRRDVNENSSEVPCSSVSPTNSATSSSNSGGGSRNGLPGKKRWLETYTVRNNTDGPAGGPAADKSSPDDQGHENGFIHSNDGSSRSCSSNGSASNSQIHNSSSNNETGAVSGSKNNNNSHMMPEKTKEKVKGASKKKPATKRLKVDSAADSEATVSESESNACEKGRRKAGIRGQKRGTQLSAGKTKKQKGDQVPADSAAIASHNHNDTGDKQKGDTSSSIVSKKSSSKQSQQVNEDSERTEDEDDEQKQEDDDDKAAAAAASLAVSSAASASSCEPPAAACKQKRGRRPKGTASSSPPGKRSSSSSNNSSSGTAGSNSVSKKEKKSKSKGSTDHNNKNKRSKSDGSCDSIDKSGQPFLQNKSCSEISSKSTAVLPKCRECKMSPSQKEKKDVGPSIFCRFYHFRKIVYNNKQLKAAGFSEPKDALDEDFRLWMPPESAPLQKEAARYLIDFVGDHFCSLVAQEAKALSMHMGSTTQIAWKKVVAGVREMCDVCETTLFNIHWVCSECGFVVCIDCYGTRREEESKEKENHSKQEQQQMAGKSVSSNGQNISNNNKSEVPEPHTPSATSSPPPPPPTTGRNQSRDRDRFDWLVCNSKHHHLQEKLILTQIISKTALWDVWKRLHELKQTFGCPCPCDNDLIVASVLKKARCSENKSLKEKDLNGCIDLQNQLLVKAEAGEAAAAAVASPLTILADVATNSSNSKHEQVIARIKKETESENGNDETEKTAASALRDLLSNGTSHDLAKAKVSSDHLSHHHSQQQQQQNTTSVQKEPEGNGVSVAPKKRGRKAPPIMSTQLNGVLRNSCDSDKPEQTLQYFSRRINPIFTSKNTAPRARKLEDTAKEFPDIDHDWWCEGRLLVFKKTGNENQLNHMPLFEQQWLQHQPIVICEVSEWLESKLWTLAEFKKKAAEDNKFYDLVDTESHKVIRDQLLKYWEGFDSMKNRFRGDDGRPAVLKLKDWPPSEEFREALPDQFEDLMSCIPMLEYTTDSADGVRNLAGRLPRSFGLSPDLGPKMYSAYGPASDEKGTTNLHLDMSDAVNILVQVATLKPKKDEEEHQKKVLEALTAAEVEKSQMDRLSKNKEKAGALWHIYDARDADKIRDMLNCYALEQGRKLHQHHDPIHDQSFYLDAKLRKRLKDHYSVVGYTIVQFLGDAVFIPAGAPHQVRNLSSCIKVAEDFVSPENVAHCFNLTEEFRQLSQAHDNHEDKLQIKNIIYHAIKDSLAAYADVTG